eukprot:927580-Amphidinium_carterae.1
MSQPLMRCAMASFNGLEFHGVLRTAQLWRDLKSFSGPQERSEPNLYTMYLQGYLRLLSKTAETLNANLSSKRDLSARLQLPLVA